MRVISNNFSARVRPRTGRDLDEHEVRAPTAFTARAIYMMRNEALDANSFSNNAQTIRAARRSA